MCGEVAEPFLKVGPPSMLSDGRLFGGDLAKFECQSCSLVFGTDYGDAGFHEHYARGYLQSSLPETLTADLEERSVHVARVVFGLALDSGLTPETVFEVGAGSGHLLRQLKVCWPTAEVSGSDLARDAVSRGSKLGLQLSVGGLEVVPEDGVDLVVAIAVLEHVPDPQNFLTRCAEVTTPGGAVVIAIPGRHVGAHDFWVRDHLWHFHQSHIVTLAHRAGLHVLTKFTGKSIYDLDYYLLARRPEPPLTHFEPVNQRRHNYAERESGLSTLRSLEDFLTASNRRLAIYGLGERFDFLRCYSHALRSVETSALLVDDFPQRARERHTCMQVVPMVDLEDLDLQVYDWLVTFPGARDRLRGAHICYPFDS